MTICRVKSGITKSTDIKERLESKDIFQGT